MMGTLFLICVILDTGRTLECGPYLSFKEASEILAEHIPAVLMAHGITCHSYKVQLIEVYANEHGWATVDVKIEAEETNRLEDFNESIAR